MLEPARASTPELTDTTKVHPAPSSSETATPMPSEKSSSTPPPPPPKLSHSTSTTIKSEEKLTEMMAKIVHDMNDEQKPPPVHTAAFDVEGFQTDSQVNLPFESIYGIACIGPAQNNPDAFRCCTKSGNGKVKKDNIDKFIAFFIMIVQNYLLLALNYVVQAMMILLLMDNAQTNFGEEESCQSDYYMRGVCMCLFLTSVYSDIEETLKMVEWHWQVPTENVLKTLLVEDIDGDDPTLVTGLTGLHKLFNLTFIILPKFTIGVMVFMYGSTFIALSPTNEDAFLNTLAGYFILEIDELLFKGFTSPILIEGAAKIPPWKRGKISKYWGMFGLLCSNICLMMIILLCALVINGWACVEPFELLPPTINTTCHVGRNSSWSISPTCANASTVSLATNGVDATPYCQQVFIATMIPAPEDFPSVTGCGQACKTTLELNFEGKQLSDLYMVSMLVELFGLLFVCCAILLAIADEEFSGIGACCMSCFTILAIVLHSLAMPVAASMQHTLHMLTNAHCIDSSTTAGTALLMAMQRLTASINTTSDLGIAVLVIASLQMVAGILLNVATLEDHRVGAGLCILCLQLLLTVMDCVAFGAGANAVLYDVGALFDFGVLGNGTRSMEGWCSTLTNSTFTCISESRGEAYLFSMLGGSTAETGLLGPGSGTLKGQ